jgi:hypothetical protein
MDSVRRRICAAAVLAALVVAAPAADAAEERSLTLYSKPITVQPYTGEQSIMGLAANGVEAPDVPGYITRMDADVVATPSPDARSLPIQDVMVHHLVYHNQDGVGRSQANCGGRFFARGEERQVFDLPEGYGVPNVRADGRAPRWALTHMLMNHRDRARTVYVRIRMDYVDAPPDALPLGLGGSGTPPVKPVEPLWLDTRGCNFDPVYDVPGGGRRGSTHLDSEDWVVPEGYSGRIVSAGGHLHGGGKFVRVTNETCGGRTIVESRAYYGMPNHEFYRVRPILHEASPVRVGIYNSAAGIPVSAGDRLRLTAGYDNRYLHTRVMNIMIAYLARGETEPCAPVPDDVRLTNRPRRYRSQPPRFIVPLIFRPRGAWRPASGPLDVGDFYFRPQRIVARRGQTVTWSFGGNTAHNVTVANGPRGFSSPWSQRGATFSYRPRTAGTYRLFCSLHPAYMAQELRVR